jgi:ATP-dependent DNA ligase
MPPPVRPPIAPMLARLVRRLPEEATHYEPKWDGFRCLAFVDGDDVDLRSRHGNPLARYFPEVVATLRGRRCVLDGELVVAGFDFPALMARLHPAASRVQLLARETPARYIAFDLLAEGDEALLDAPFAQRRARLEALVPELATPATDDPEQARAWLERRPPGIDGVVVKAPDGRYEPGARAMLKVKLERTADCVVAGLRGTPDPEPRATSLLLGLYDENGALQHVGVAGSLGRRRGQEVLAALGPYATDLAGHPWEHGFLMQGGPTGRLKGAAGRWDPATMPLDWVPLRPERVAEVAYEQLDGHRFRHPGRFRRWRDDREPASCRVEQLD